MYSYIFYDLKDIINKLLLSIFIRNGKHSESYLKINNFFTKEEKVPLRNILWDAIALKRGKHDTLYLYVLNVFIDENKRESLLDRFIKKIAIVFKEEHLAKHKKNYDITKCFINSFKKEEIDFTDDEKETKMETENENEIAEELPVQATEEMIDDASVMLTAESEVK